MMSVAGLAFSGSGGGGGGSEQFIVYSSRQKMKNFLS